jgi:hypothetical protein
MLPTDMIETLTMKIAEVIDGALAGEIADGYTVLLAGLRRGEEIAEEGRRGRWSWWRGGARPWTAMPSGGVWGGRDSAHSETPPDLEGSGGYPCHMPAGSPATYGAGSAQTGR